MRAILFFDLPSTTAEQMKEYRKFRKFLINEGFIMLQESVYTKLAITPTVMNSVKLRMEKNKPTDGLVQMIIVTEKQFASMDYIVGNRKKGHIDTVERLVIL